MTITFTSHLGEDHKTIEVSATITRSSGMDENGYGAGILVEDLTVMDSETGQTISLSPAEHDSLRAEAANLFQHSQ